MYRIITTVGTSLITNYMNIEPKYPNGYVNINDMWRELNELTVKDVELEYEEVVNDIKKVLTNYWIKGLRKKQDGSWYESDEYNEDCCAEIKTLLEFYKKEKERINKDFEIEVLLIATDTASSTLAAKLIKENISNFNKNIRVINDVIVVKGLQTEDFGKFNNEGIDELFDRLLKIVKETEKINKENSKKRNNSNENEIKTIINISGGYKALIPYMTIFAQVYNIESIYIYEDSNSLITIPPLPIQIDWAFAELYYPYLSDPALNRDVKKQKYLAEKGLLKRRGEDEDYNRTSLGSFFCNAIDNNLHVSKNVMGYFFEYKLYEYYVESMYPNEYSKVSHSEYIENQEIDLIIRPYEQNKDYKAIEVKPIKAITDEYSFMKLKEKIIRHKKAMKEYGQPIEYHLCFYTPDERNFNELTNENENIKNARKKVRIQIKSLRELRKIFEDTDVQFKAFIIKAKYNIDEKDRIINKYMKDANPYQQLMKDKLVYGKNFKEIYF